MTRSLFLLSLFACSGGDKDGTEGGFPENTAEAVANYATIVEATYADSISGAEALSASLTAFVAAPSEAGLTAAKQAWLDSREPYLLTEAYRFYEGPIDNATDGPEGALNAWPLDENVIDYVVGDANAGIVNDTDVTIDAATIAGLNGVGGEAAVTTGYHAVEFLLWGQDLSDAGPGARPYTDYVTGEGGTQANQGRRGQYLTVAGDLIVSDLEFVHAQWTTDAAYRTAFEADAEGSFAKILTGLIILSGFETGGERLQAALDSGDREDEHSCFSDNTHRDMIQDVQGIQNVWLGTYGSISGTGIRDVVGEVDADLASQVTAQIAESLSLANAMEVPFEGEIAPGNADGHARVQALIDSLRAQEELLQDVFIAFDLSIPSPE